jgi:hypothetical protein
MEQFLRKIRLIEDMNITLPIGKQAFIQTLRTHVDPPSFGLFSVFEGGKNEYKGTVTENGFELRRRRRMFDSKLSISRSVGLVSQSGNQLQIDIMIKGYNGYILFMIIMFIVVYGIGIVATLFAGLQNDKIFWGAPFILIHATVMIGIFYAVVRRGVRRTKYDLERDLYFMMRNKLNSNKQDEGFSEERA